MEMFQWNPERTALDETVSKHREWMQDFLGVPESSWTYHKKGDDVSSHLVPYGLFHNISERKEFYSNKQELVVARDITGVTFAPKSKWVYHTDSKRVGKTTASVNLGWGDLSSVVGFCIPKAGIKAVFLRKEYEPGPGAKDWSQFNCIVTSSEDSVKLRAYLKEILNADQEKGYTIYTYDADSNGQTTCNSSSGITQSWDNLVLDPSIIRLVQRDIDSFFARKEWFLRNFIPFRRGYLLHGPPGNGKTSVVKAMLSALGMNAYKIRLFSSKVTDETLEAAFRNAQESGPNMMILEDLDRAFPKTGERKSPIGLHTLLNCLDGLESQEGVITIATANEPTALDKAILKRPGRFDRVILFDNPNKGLRQDFFIKKAPYLANEDLSSAVDSTEGFSFAQLQETYVMAGQYAYERSSEEVTVFDLHSCAAELRGATNDIKPHSEKVGYFK